MPIKYVFKGIIGFIILDLYFNLVPVQLANPYLQFITTLLFFPIAYVVSRWVGIAGLKGLGLFFHQGWKKNFCLSFMIGFSLWILMFGIQFLSGELVYINSKSMAEITMPILEIFVGYFVGSLINDLVVRGYVFGLLKGRMHIGWVFMVSIVLYALDDYWYAGFNLSNIIFSIILGLSLTLAFYKTGSIWADTGIHYGLNIAYGLFFGLVGNPESAIFSIRETAHHTFLTESLPYTIPAIMLIVVLWASKYYIVHNSGNSFNFDDHSFSQSNFQ